MNILYKPTSQTVKKMRTIYKLKKDRYTFRAIAEMIGHSVTYTKILHKQYLLILAEKENHDKA